MDKTILYKFASRSRPKKFLAAIHNIVSLSATENYIIVCSLDTDDETMNNPVMIDNLNQYQDVLGKRRFIYHFGTSRNKIDAINRDLEKLPRFDILCNFSDDMRFLSYGYDKTIISDMAAYFPDGDGFLCYHDGGKETKGLSTMSIMGASYFKLFNYIYFSGYESVYSDNEATEVAKRMGKFMECDGSLFSHDHPANGKGEMDAQYARTEHFEVHHRDKALFDKRQANGFYLSTSPMLSILICTLPERQEMLDHLLGEISGQAEMLPMHLNDFNVITDADTTITTGEKRNRLLDRANGRFVVYIDDDDHILPGYMKEIMTAIHLHPTIDCISIDGIITSNGLNEANWTISVKYEKWYTEAGAYYRTPNHITPVRRELADLVRFPHISDGEDFAYSMGLIPYLKRERKIDRKLYHYDYRTK